MQNKNYTVKHRKNNGKNEKTILKLWAISSILIGTYQNLQIEKREEGQKHIRNK